MISAFRLRQTARTALRLLAQERQALLSGRFAALAALSTQIERCAEVLEGQGRTDDAEIRKLLAQVREAARHNQSLTEAARRGLRTAAKAHRDARDGAARLQTYPNRGRAQVILNAGLQQNDRRT